MQFQSAPGPPNACGGLFLQSAKEEGPKSFLFLSLFAAGQWEVSTMTMLESPWRACSRTARASI